MNKEMIGRMAFYIGLAISVVAGLIELGDNGILVLAVLGLVVGLLNVTGKESHRFLLSTIALIVAGVAIQGIFGNTVDRILVAYIVFTAVSAVVVALKEVWAVQKSR